MDLAIQWTPQNAKRIEVIQEYRGAAWVKTKSPSPCEFHGTIGFINRTRREWRVNSSLRPPPPRASLPGLAANAYRATEFSCASGFWLACFQMKDDDSSLTLALSRVTFKIR